MFIKKVHKFKDNNLEFHLYATKPDEGVITISPIGNSDIIFRFGVNKDGAKKIAKEFTHYAEECFKEEIKLGVMLIEESVLENKIKITETLEMLLNEIKPTVRTVNQKARIIFCKDSSGSMGSYEQHAAKSFSTWNYGILSNLYSGNVQSDYVSFHTEANAIYDSEEFFSRGESGGTIVSSGLNKVNDIMNGIDYLTTDIYVFLLSDGDNLTSDNDKVIRVLSDIQRKAKHVSYFEINQYNRSSTLNSVFRHVNYSNFVNQRLGSNEDMLPILKKMWSTIN